MLCLQSGCFGSKIIEKNETIHFPHQNAPKHQESKTTQVANLKINPIQLPIRENTKIGGEFELCSDEAWDLKSGSIREM